MRSKVQLWVVPSLAALLYAWTASPAIAQATPPAPAEHQHDASDASSGGHHHGGGAVDREGSGTSWLPDTTPMYALHYGEEGWTFMVHGNAFVQYLYEEGRGGEHQVGSINWIMGMADHKLGGGRLRLTGMASLEPWTIDGCGYPDLLATGENCNGLAIHDLQHPHDLFMELAVMYDRPLGKGLNMQLYAAPVGEPALGPVAFMHRTSATPNPLAPISHHWFDSTHITYGVLTAGLYGQKWKAEGSAFNGREPDEDRTDFDFDTLDSWSGRVWWLPTKDWAFQFSTGHLKEAEQHELDQPRIDVDRYTLSATYHYMFENQYLFANTVGWGMNDDGDDPTNAFFVESNFTINDTGSIFARYEAAQKSTHDLGLPGDTHFTVHKIQAGYNHYFANWRGLKPGVGVSFSSGIVPNILMPVYGDTSNPGVGVYFTMRPAGHAPR